MTTSQKQALVRELVTRLRADLETMERAQRDTVAGAISAEARPEHAKDTRALEQTYLARGQAQRVVELRDGIARVMTMPIRAFPSDALVSLGALVTIDSDEGEESGERVLFVAPFGGGLRLARGEQVVTPASPLGRALIGKQTGDECRVVLDRRTRVVRVRSVG